MQTCFGHILFFDEILSKVSAVCVQMVMVRCADRWIIHQSE